MRTFYYAILCIFCSISQLTAQYTPKDFSRLVQEKKYTELSALIQSTLDAEKYNTTLMKMVVNLPIEEQLALLEASKSTFFQSYDAVRLVSLGDSFMIEKFSTVLTSLQRMKKAEKKWYDWAMLSIRIIDNCYMNSNFKSIDKNYEELFLNLEKIDSNEALGVLISGGNYYMGVVNNFEKAEQFFYKIIELKRKGKLFNIPYPYSSLADLYFRKQDYERAFEFSNKVLKGNSLNEREIVEELLRTGYIYYLKNDLAKAQQYYDEVKRKIPLTKESMQNPFLNRQIIIYYTQCTELHLEANTNYPEVHFFIKDLLPLAKSSYAILKAQKVLIDYSNRFDDTGLFEGILWGFQKQYALPNMRAPICVSIGDYYYKKNDKSQALAYYDMALDGLKGEVKNGLATYTLDEPEAFEALSQKLKLLMTQKKMGLSLNNMSIENLNQLIYQTTQEAIVLLDDLRKSQTTKSAQLRILERTPQVYETAIQLATELYIKSKDKKYLEQIYNFMEKSKAMLLADVLAENEAKEFGGVPEKYRKEEKQLQNDLKFYELELFKAQKMGNQHQITTFENIIFEKRNALEELKKKLEKEYPKYFEYKFDNQIASIKEVQAKLQEQNMVFISYFVGKNNIYVLKIDANSYDIRQIALPNNLIPNLDVETRSFRAFLSEFAKISNITPDEYQRFASSGHRFYQLLLEPELKNCKAQKLLLSFDGILHYIPAEVFLTAPIKKEDAINYQSLAYLVHQFTISYTYNATLWLKAIEQQKSLKPTSGGILGMAATYKPSEVNKNNEWGKIRLGLEELSGAKNEINYLKSTFLGQYWFDKDATEAQFLKNAPNYNIIHLALHGLVDGELPMNSGLVFSDNGDTASNNILQAYELPNVSLNANLVILSACSTGDGQYASGEGVMSLGRSFMYAGASSIMTSLWQLNDISSEHLMRIFYEKLQKGLPKDEALQQAKIEYLSQAQGFAGHPAFWAALVLIGENSPVPVYKEWATGWIIGGILALLGIAGFMRYRKKN